MTSTPEAPVAEPQPVQTAAAAAKPGGATAPATVEIQGVAHAFGELPVIDRLELVVKPGEVLGIVGPSGCGKSTLLELVGGLREPSAGAIAVGGTTTPKGRLGRCAYMPQRDLLLPWLTAIDNAALAPRNRGASRTAARRVAHPLFERFGLAGFERARPVRALRRHETADRFPSHAARRQTGAAARRAVRLARRDHARRDAGVAGRGARRRVTHHDPRHPRRRGGALPVRPGGRALGAAGSRGRRVAPAVAARPAAHRHGHLHRASLPLASGPWPR